MKLTLRTLIAFLDETIDENDAAELRKKIKESEAIRELIERIRQIISQPQLMALRVAGKGLGADSNYSSEYIDNTLDLEQVAEFEKLAIGSDMLLAEIAESHQILANFNQTDEAVSLRLQSRLHKTVQTIYPVDAEEPEVFPVIEDHSSIHEDYEDVSPPKKKKTRTNLAPPIIETVQDGDPANPVTHSPTVHAPPVIQSIQPPPPTSSIEDSNGPLQPGLTPFSSNTQKSKGSGCSLGEPTDPSDKNQHPRIKILPVVLATACITSLLFLVIASFVNPNVPEIASNDLKNNVKSSTQEQANHKEQTSKPETDGSSTETGGEVTRPILKTKSNNEQQGERPTTIPTRDSKTTAAGNGSNPKERPPQTPETIAERQGQEKEVVNLFKDKDYENKKPPLPESRELAANTNTNQSTVPKIDPSKKLTDTKVLMSKTASLVNGPSIGIIKSDQEPAVRRTNLNEAKWVSLGKEQTIHLNDRVAALPGCRPTIEIMGSVRLHLFGFCEIEFKENPGKVIPQLLVRNGIVTLENMKDPNNTIDVSIQGTNYQITFADPKSRITVVSHSTPPRKHLAPVVQIVAEHAKGIISFGGKVIFLEPMEMVKVSGSDHLKTKFKTKPVSMTQKIDKLTQSAKKDFYDLSLENPVLEIALSKSRSTQSPYLRNFAVKSTVALGGFLPFVNFLRDEQNTPFWREAVRSFRQNLLSDAHLFDLGRKFFEESSSPDPQTAKQDLLFFQMLTTTTDQELASGRAELLVRSLENSNLAVRVAAIQSLYALTGKDQFFRADAPATKRQKGLKAWKKVLQTTGITVLTPFQLMQFE